MQYGKLSEEQKSFVDPENAAYLENEVLPRLKELQDNKKLSRTRKSSSRRFRRRQSQGLR